MRQRAKSVPTLYNKLDIKHKNLCIERRLLICPDKPQRVKTFCQHLREKCIFRHKPGTSWIQQCRHRNVIFTLIYLQTINKVFYCFSGNLLSSFYRHIQVYKSAVDDIAQFGQDCVDINTLFTVFYLRQGGGYTTTSVCLHASRSVCVHDYCKSNQEISLILNVTIGLTNRKTDSLPVVILSRIRTPDHCPHFPHYCGIGDFWRFTSICYTVIGRFSRRSAK